MVSRVTVQLTASNRRPRIRRSHQLLLAIVAMLVSDFGCQPAGTSYRSEIQSDKPTDRIRAIYKAGESRDPKAVALLVDRLEDEDEGVRLFAFLALEKITGERFDYDYASPPPMRAIAVSRWRAYVKERFAAAGTPTPGHSDTSSGEALAVP